MTNAQQQPNREHQPHNDDHHDERERLNARLQAMSEEQFRRQMREASLLLSTGKAKEALPLLERCFELHPDDVNVLTNLGGALILLGLHRRAIPVLERATELAPTNPNVWSNLAAAYLGKLVTATGERQEKALEAYRRVIELDAAYPNVHYNMGLIFVDRREWDEAHAAFTRALQYKPDDKDAALMRRRVLEVRQKPADPTLN